MLLRRQNLFQLTSSCQRSFHKIPDVGEQGIAAVVVEFWESLVIPNRFLLAGLVSTKGHCSEKSLVSAGQTWEVDDRRWPWDWEEDRSGPLRGQEVASAAS